MTLLISQYDLTEAACCIWEYLLQQRRINPEIQTAFSDYGYAHMRYLAIIHADQCHLDYAKAVEKGYDDAFDWDFVPDWVEKYFNVA